MNFDQDPYEIDHDRLEEAIRKTGQNMKVAATGHRPNKLQNDYDGTGPMSKWIKKEINNILDKHSPTMLISGMALGVDMLFAEIAIERKLDLLAAIPCKGQEKVWPKKSQDRYNKILSYENCEKVYVNEKYSGWAMQQRNEYMVDSCGLLLAVWDGTTGGTCNAVQYAKKVNKEIIRINPQDFYDKGI